MVAACNLFHMVRRYRIWADHTLDLENNLCACTLSFWCRKSYNPVPTGVHVKIYPWNERNIPGMIGRVPGTLRTNSDKPMLEVRAMLWVRAGTPILSWEQGENRDTSKEGQIQRGTHPKRDRSKERQIQRGTNPTRDKSKEGQIHWGTNPKRDRSKEDKSKEGHIRRGTHPTSDKSNEGQIQRGTNAPFKASKHPVSITRHSQVHNSRVQANKSAQLRDKCSSWLAITQRLEISSFLTAGQIIHELYLPKIQ